MEKVTTPTVGLEYVRPPAATFIMMLKKAPVLLSLQASLFSQKVVGLSLSDSGIQIYAKSTLLIDISYNELPKWIVYDEGILELHVKRKNDKRMMILRLESSIENINNVGAIVSTNIADILVCKGKAKSIDEGEKQVKVDLVDREALRNGVEVSAMP